MAGDPRRYRTEDVQEARMRHDTHHQAGNNSKSTLGMFLLGPAFGAFTLVLLYFLISTGMVYALQ